MDKPLTWSAPSRVKPIEPKPADKTVQTHSLYFVGLILFLLSWRGAHYVDGVTFLGGWWLMVCMIAGMGSVVAFSVAVISDNQDKV